jgi:hypothetical protein
VIPWWSPVSLGSFAWFLLAEMASEVLRVLGR